MHIGVPLETHAGETRVAATPETIKKLIGQGHQVTVQAGAGVSASIPDSAYTAVGASIGNDAAALGADRSLDLSGIRTMRTAQSILQSPSMRSKQTPTHQKQH